MGNGSIILLMTGCFLVFGYMGVPVAFRADGRACLSRAC